MVQRVSLDDAKFVSELRAKAVIQVAVRRLVISPLHQDRVVMKQFKQKQQSKNFHGVATSITDIPIDHVDVARGRKSVTEEQPKYVFQLTVSIPDYYQFSCYWDGNMGQRIWRARIYIGEYSLK